MRRDDLHNATTKGGEANAEPVRETNLPEGQSASVTSGAALNPSAAPEGALREARAKQIVNEADETCDHNDYPGACLACLTTVIAAALAGQPARDKQEKLVKEGDRAREYCDRCDGCGWYEGGKTLQTKCEDCNGTGTVEAK